MRYNKLMEQYIFLFDYDCNKSKLIEKLSSEFIEEDNCYVLKDFFTKPAAKKNTIEDKIGYECLANKFHVKYLVDCKFLEEAICFVKHTLHNWNKLHGHLTMIGIISIEFPIKDAVVRFHLSRPGALQWLSDDLEGYEINGVLVMYSNEEL